jgi:hypothetical protein
VVYPVNIRGAYRCHTAPGKWWDSVYTWDAGFCGLGLAHIARDRAVESLDTYLGDETDEDHAFLHHGTPLPVQAYLAKELTDLDPERPGLRHDVRRLLRYYEFLAGRLGSSTTNPFRSELRTTFSYFYNSGGWDDYPAQVETHKRGIASRTAPIVTNAHLLRFGSILRGLADIADCTALVDHVRSDQERILSALRKHAWDGHEGVFGYVEHDTEGNPKGILRSATGENMNKGLDGVSPIVTGLLTEEERRYLISRIVDPNRMWTPWGISTVDMSAGYYRQDGYWNGAVWMPHQWFVWKSFLDLGYGQYAWDIARTALEMWNREVTASGRCYEHFLVANGRGAGWHQFGGLSSPIINWYVAYYVPGTLTVGFDTFVLHRDFDPNERFLSAQLSYTGHAAKHVVLICLKGRGYTVLWNGTPVTSFRSRGEACEIELPGENGLLEVSVDTPR